MLSPPDAIPLAPLRRPGTLVTPCGSRPAAAPVSVTLLAAVLWLPMKLMPAILVVATIAQLAMAYTYFFVRHQPFGGCMSLVMVLLYCFVAGALLQFQTWLIRKREALQW